MSKQRPKILSAVTVPTGGWDLVFKISLASSLDTTLTATVAAGTYFVAWDGQSDDILWELQEKMEAQLGGNGQIIIYIDDNRKVNFKFQGFVDSVGYENDILMDWNSGDADLAKLLGFTSNDSSTSTDTDNPVFTARYPHGYGWYATEDGQLESLGRADDSLVNVSQARAINGDCRTQLHGVRYRNTLALNWLTEAQTWSAGTAYATLAAFYPYDRNEALECWWLHCKGGTRFRVYRRDERVVPQTAALAVAINDTASGSKVADATQSWGTAPNEFLNMCVLINTDAAPKRFLIASNTATELNSPNTLGGSHTWGPDSDEALYIVDMRYETYHVDSAKMKVFAPQEIPVTNRYAISIPLLRYVS